MAADTDGMDAEITVGTPQPTMTNSPMPAGGRPNEHIRFGSGGEARVVPPPVRAGCWVASLPVDGEMADLTLLHKCDEPTNADDWTADEWAEWDMGQWETWEAEWDAWDNAWDGKWQSEYGSDEDADDEAVDEGDDEQFSAVSPMPPGGRQNAHIRFVPTPCSAVKAEAFGEEGVLRSERGATPTEHKHEGRSAALELASFLKMVSDYETLPNGCASIRPKTPPPLPERPSPHTTTPLTLPLCSHYCFAL